MTCKRTSAALLAQRYRVHHAVLCARAFCHLVHAAFSGETGLFEPAGDSLLGPLPLVVAGRYLAVVGSGSLDVSVRGVVVIVRVRLRVPIGMSNGMPIRVPVCSAICVPIRTALDRRDWIFR